MSRGKGGGEMREGQREGQREVGSYPSHCSHVWPHLIGRFAMSLQEEDGRPDRLVKGRIMIMLGSDGMRE